MDREKDIFSKSAGRAQRRPGAEPSSTPEADRTHRVQVELAEAVQVLLDGEHRQGGIGSRRRQV